MLQVWIEEHAFWINAVSYLPPVVPARVHGRQLFAVYIADLTPVRFAAIFKENLFASAVIRLVGLVYRLVYRNGDCRLFISGRQPNIVCCQSAVFHRPGISLNLLSSSVFMSRIQAGPCCAGTLYSISVCLWGRWLGNTSKFQPQRSPSPANGYSGVSSVGLMTLIWAVSVCGYQKNSQWRLSLMSGCRLSNVSSSGACQLFAKSIAGH